MLSVGDSIWVRVVENELCVNGKVDNILDGLYGITIIENSGLHGKISFAWRVRCDLFTEKEYHDMRGRELAMKILS